ncbi:hypothetical protein ACRW5D_27710, partial [Escherichia coli]
MIRHRFPFLSVSPFHSFSLNLNHDVKDVFIGNDSNLLIVFYVQIMPDDFVSKRAARTVLTGMCYSVGSATRQGSSSPTRFIG